MSMVKESFRINHSKNNNGLLDFSGRSLTMSDCKKLCKRLIIDEFIEDVRFTDCLLSEEVSNGIINALAFNKAIKCIDLKGNNIRTCGAERICKLLKQTLTLRELYLEWNTLGLYDTSIAAIAEGLAMNQTVQILDLSNNQICHKGGKELAVALKRNKTLHSLDLRWNNIGISGGREILSALSHNKSLVNLQLAGNNIPSDTIKAIATAIQRNVDYHTMEEQHLSLMRALKEKADHLHQEKSLEVSTLTNELEKEKELHQSFSFATRSQLEEMKNLIDELQKENESLKKVNKQLESDYDSARKTVSTLEESVKSLNEANSMMREKYGAESSKMEQDINNERKEWRTEVTNKDHQISSLEENLKMLQENVESYSSEITNLKSILKVKKEEYETQYILLEEKYQKEKEWNKKENSDQIKSLTEKIARHVNDNDRLEFEVSKLKSTMITEKLKHEEDIVLQRTRWKQDDVLKSKQYEERIDLLVASKGELQAKVSKLVIQESEHHSKLVSCEKDAENYKRQNEHLQELMKRRDQDHHDEINRLHLEIDVERKEMMSVKSKMDSLQTKHQDLESEFNLLRASKESEVSKLKEIIRSKEDEIRRNQQDEMKRTNILEAAMQTYLTSARSNKY